MQPRGLSSISYEAPPGVGGGAAGGRAERLSWALREAGEDENAPGPGRKEPAGPKKPPGIREIAESLGLSIGTVDRALHDRPGINEETRRRIVQRAQSVGNTGAVHSSTSPSGRSIPGALRPVARLLGRSASAVVAVELVAATIAF